MLPRSFRITNYKSIVDSGTCWLASDLTVLAGKNESGKSAILELRDFDPNATIAAEAHPLSDDSTPTISVTFEIGPGDLDRLVVGAQIPDAAGPRLADALLRDGLELVRTTAGFQLGETIAAIANHGHDPTGRAAYDRIAALVEKLPEKFRVLFPTAPPPASALKETMVTALTACLDVPLEPGEQPGARLPSELLDEIQKIALAYSPDPLAPTISAFVVKECLPRFIFFSDFQNLLPDDVPIATASANPAVSDFARVAGLDLTKLAAATDPQRRTNMLGTKSADVSGNFKHSWRQDNVDLIAENDGDLLRFWVREHGSNIKHTTRQRSQGFKWFLSFYLRLKAENAKTAVILIDEPGLYLHAKAQGDVLDVLAELHEKDGHKIIFSSHSPYLMDFDRYDRLRLVIKGNPGGTVITKIHAGADIETLTPIITAIGLDVVRQLSVPGTKKNLLTEGISDYYYLQAVKKLLPTAIPNEISIIACVGATKIPQLASLLIGWGHEYAAVFDNDREGKRVAAELRKSPLVADSQIIFVPTDRDGSIEDLFSVADFQQLVLDAAKTTAPAAQTNSTRVAGLDKVLLAKKFFELSNTAPDNIQLSAETTANFSAFADRVRAAFVPVSPRNSL